MSDFQAITTLKTDGVHPVGRSPVSGFCLSVDGVFAGATAEFGYISPSGEFVRYNAVPVFTQNDQQIVTVMFDVELAFKVIGATATTSLTASLHETTFEPLYGFDDGHLTFKTLQ